MAIAGATKKESIPAPLHDEVMPESGWDGDQRESAVFAGGCFWGVQSVFQRVKGVEKTTVGYSGGAKYTADYRAVSTHRHDGACGGDRDHLRSVEGEFWNAFEGFFSVVHDPTQLDRQGNDVGTQYRSAIFYTDDEQREVAEAYVKQPDEAHIFPRPIVTQIVPLEHFFGGEEYHQDYAIKNPHNPYIQVCDIPKIADLERQFPALFQEYRP